MSKIQTVNKPLSIQVFLVDGEPEGILTATIPFQWTGYVLIFKRTHVKRILEREEVEQSGVYLLIEENEESLYIGQSYSFEKHIVEQEQNKKSWSTGIFITSTEKHLNKNHLHYLQEQLIKRAKKANKIILEKDDFVSEPSLVLSEATIPQMEDYLEKIILILSVLKFQYF